MTIRNLIEYKVEIVFDINWDRCIFYNDNYSCWVFKNKDVSLKYDQGKYNYYVYNSNHKMIYSKTQLENWYK